MTQSLTAFCLRFTVIFVFILIRGFTVPGCNVYLLHAPNPVISFNITAITEELKILLQDTCLVRLYAAPKANRLVQYETQDRTIALKTYSDVEGVCIRRST